MSPQWSKIIDLIRDRRSVVRVSVIDVDGSVPRDAGAWMIVSRDDFEQTIGGGRLEYEAIAVARAMIAAHGDIGPLWQREERVYPLGPGLGQCCGGAVRLLFELLTMREINTLAVDQVPIDEKERAVPALLVRPTASGAPLILASNRKTDYQLPAPVARVVKDMLAGARPRQATYIKPAAADTAWVIEPMGGRLMPLYIYGAGHVGRAIVDLAPQLPFKLRWVDTARDRFPSLIPGHAAPVITQVPQDLARRCPAGAFHVVLTFSHALDLAICEALLARADFAFLGLIGSKTKRARFKKKLREGGISQNALDQLVCPIGISTISGKEPATIALSTVAQLVERLETLSQQADNRLQRGDYV